MIDRKLRIPAVFLVGAFCWSGVVCKPLSAEVPASGETHAVQDLRTWDFDKNYQLALKDHWRIWPGELIDWQQLEDLSPALPFSGFWSLRGFLKDGHGVVSYVTRIRLSQEQAKNSYAVRGPAFFNNAYQIEVYEPTSKLKQVIVSSGVVGLSKETTIPKATWNVAPIPHELTAGGDFYLVLKGANFRSLGGGSLDAVLFGLSEPMLKRETNKGYETNLLVGMFLLVAIYNISNFIQRHEDRSSLFLFIFVFFQMLRYIGTERLIYHYFPEPLLWKHILHEKMVFLSGTLSTIGSLSFVVVTFPKLMPIILKRMFYLVLVSFAVTTILVPVWVLQALMIPLTVSTSLVFMTLLVRSMMVIDRRKSDEALLVIGLFFVVTTFFNDVLAVVIPNYHFPYLAHYGLLVFSILSSQVPGIRFARTYQLTKELSDQLRNANEELLENEKARTLFFHNTSHELRTPLNGIIGFVQLLERGSYGHLPEKAGTQIAKVGRLALGLKDQVNTILDLAKARRGELQPLITNLDLNELVTDVRYIAEGLSLKAENFAFSYHINWRPEDDLRFYSDKEKIKTIIRNLLGNAFKFSRPGLRNHIHLWLSLSETRQLKIVVRDQGIGIPAEQAIKIFEEFQQVENDSRRRYEGTGLGLAMVKQISAVLRGRIRIYSTMNQGTQIEVILPESALEHDLKSRRNQALTPEISDHEELITFSENLQEAQNPTEATLVSQQDSDGMPKIADLGATHSDLPPVVARIKAELSIDEPVPQQNQQDYTVLVVDDNATNCELIKDCLQSEQYTVHIALGGQQAIDYLNKKHVSVVVLDLMMPEVSGEDVLRFIKHTDHLSDVPVILVTARATNEDRLQGLKLGADDYIAKPIDPDELLFRVRNILARLELTSQLRVQEYQERMARLGEFVNDITHEIKNLHLRGDDYYDLFQEKSFLVLNSSPLGKADWGYLTSRQRHYREYDLLIPANLGEQEKMLLADVRRELSQFIIPQIELDKIWQRLLSLDLKSLTLAEATVTCMNHLWMLSQNSRQTQKIVKNILSFGRKNVQKSPVILDEITNNCLSLLQMRLTRAHIEVECDLQAHAVLVNPIEIQQVLMNLLINAHDALVEAATEQPYIHIRARQKGEATINIFVANNGPAIANEHLDKIFQRKFTTKDTSGSGIGLFISQRLVRKNGGQLTVRSNPTETVFILELPRYSKESSHHSQISMK